MCPISPGDKAASFDRVEALLKEYAVDVTVLARFMQIIPDAFAEAHLGQMINIHHSFLPSFVGARPYEQAHARGVKLVGDTCHYVTPELDEGPIIDQEVVRISHLDTPADLRRKGRICERGLGKGAAVAPRGPCSSTTTARWSLAEHFSMPTSG